MVDIANVLKEFRQRTGLEQSDLALKLGVTQQTVSNWESGTVPRPTAMRRIQALVSEQGMEVPFAHMVQAQQQIQTPPPNTIRLGVDNPLMVRNRAFETELFDLLSENIEFETYAKAEMNGVRMRVDYLSPKVCAEIKHVRHPGMSSLIDLGILQLSTVRKIHERSSHLRKHYVLLIVPIDPATPVRSTRVFNLAALHDISAVIAFTPEQCAAILTDFEKDRFVDDLIDDYE